MNPQNPTNPLDPTVGDTSDAPATPMPGEAIQPSSTPADSVVAADPTITPTPVTTSLDPAMVASDPSPLDGTPAEAMPQPEAFQPPQPVEPTDSPLGVEPTIPEPPVPMEPTPPEPLVPAPQPTPEPQQVNVTVDQPQQSSSSSSVPSFLSQPKSAETSAPAQPAAPAMTPAPATSDGGPNLPPVIVHTGKKSRVLLIVIVLVILLAGGGAAAYFLTRKDGSTASNNSDNTNSSQSDDSDKDEDEEPNDNPVATGETVTAQYSSEFDVVCEGGTVSNSSAYTGNKSAIIYSFRNKPTTPDSWSSIMVGYGKSYYLEDLDKFTEINVVACLEYDDSNSGPGIPCEFEDSQGTKVTVTYKPLKYTMTLREAKTGKQIGDTQQIDGPATKCPSSVLYDRATKTAYADPDDDALEAALDKFVQ